jgi:hypothetical protein
MPDSKYDVSSYFESGSPEGWLYTLRGSYRIVKAVVVVTTAPPNPPARHPCPEPSL